MTRDQLIASLLRSGRVRINVRLGHVYTRCSGNRPAGNLNSSGYLRVHLGTARINGRRSQWVFNHHLIYFAARGVLPPGHEIDHRNHRKTDNRIVNLAAVTHSRNVANWWRSRR